MFRPKIGLNSAEKKYAIIFENTTGKLIWKLDFPQFFYKV